MRITTKGQVTIPQHIREKLHLTPHSEVEFIEEKGRIFIRKSKGPSIRNRLNRLRGVATVRMSTDDIMALIREQT